MNKELKEHLKSLEDLQDVVKDVAERSLVHKDLNVGLGVERNSTIDSFVILGLLGLWLFFLGSFF